jgi:hypothetical protein
MMRMPPSWQQVLDERELFDQQLPELLKEIPGRWVVFKNGAVCSVHDGLEEAYRAALKQFGPNAGFLITCVEVQKTVLVPSVFDAERIRYFPGR